MDWIYDEEVEALSPTAFRALSYLRAECEKAGGELPGDGPTLARLSRAGRAWGGIRKSVEPFFEQVGGRWYNVRIATDVENRRRRNSEPTANDERTSSENAERMLSEPPAKPKPTKVAPPLVCITPQGTVTPSLKNHSPKSHEPGGVSQPPVPPTFGQRPAPPADNANTLIKAFHDKLAETLKETPVGFNGGRAASIFRELLKKFDAASIRRRMAAWFASDHKYIVDRNWCVEDFERAWNRLKDGPIRKREAETRRDFEDNPNPHIPSAEETAARLRRT